LTDTRDYIDNIYIDDDESSFHDNTYGEEDEGGLLETTDDHNVNDQSFDLPAFNDTAGDNHFFCFQLQ